MKSTITVMKATMRSTTMSLYSTLATAWKCTRLNTTLYLKMQLDGT